MTKFFLVTILYSARNTTPLREGLRYFDILDPPPPLAELLAGTEESTISHNALLYWVIPIPDHTGPFTKDVGLCM